MNRKKNVLIIEDDTSVALMLARLLERAGCSVRVADTGEQGLELALENRFDLITLDVDLPGMTGLTILQELRQRHISRRTPIVMISGRATEGDQRNVLELGATDYISKPFGESEFVSWISSLVQPVPSRQNANSSDFPDEDTDTNTQGFCDAPQGNQ